MKQVLLLATTMLTASAMVAPAHALDEAAMMKQMQAMQAQMETMQRQMSSMKAELDKAKADQKTVAKAAEEIKSAKIAKTPESDVKISMVPAPKFETADGAYSFKIGGFAQIDAFASQDDRRDHPDGTNVRRARLNASGTIANDWKYKIENDFAGNASTLTDVFIEYTAFNPVTLTVGQFKEPFGLDTLTSDLFTTFNERALLNAFSPDRRIGAMAHIHGKTAPIGAWTAAAGWFGSNTASTSSTDDEAQDVTGRLTWAPFSEKTEVLHLAVAGSHRVPDRSANTYTISSRPENQMSSSAADLAVTTGAIASVESVDLLGLEAAAVYGPFSLQGEYTNAQVNRYNGFADQTFEGYYAEASWFVTGESRNYNAKAGRFERTSPKWAFKPSEGNWGALQLATRYSKLDLSDTVVRGGDIEDISFGVNWIPLPYVAVKANYILTNMDAYAVTPNDDPQTFILRAQIDF